MELKPLIALLGIVVAAMTVEFNDSITELELGDIGGAVGFGHDSGTWFDSLYLSAEVVGMAMSPWFLVTFTLRRWCLFVIALTCASTVLIPQTRNLSLLFILRSIQGLSEGLTIPLLMTTALRVLGPEIRLYGLATYALSATFFPNLSAAFAGLYIGTGDSPLGWTFSYYQSIPFCLVSGVMIWFGMPQDEPHYERFALFNWRGALLLLLGFGALTTLLQQGDRYDWFNSDTMCVLGLVSVVAVPLLLWNEWNAKIPFLKLDLLGRRNIAFGVIALFAFIVIGLAGSTLPNDYLQEVQGFLPAQSWWITAEIAATQLVFLPLVAVLLNFEWVDARVVILLGLVMVLAACVGDSFLTSVWMRPQFYLWQGLISLGDAMVVVSLLMLATNAVKKPEAPFASSLVNTPRAIAEAVGVWLVQLIDRWRGDLHSSRLTDQAGQERFSAVQAHAVLANDPAPLLPNGMPRAPGSFERFADAVARQADVLTLSDGFLVMAALTIVLMIVVLTLPVRSPPPRIALSQH